MSDKTIRLTVDFTYDPVGMHGDDEDSIEWFYNDILFGDYLQLKAFGDIGDEIGSVKVVSVDQTLAELISTMKGQGHD